MQHYLARERLPESKIFIYSNGDLATKKKMRALEEAGMKFIHISNYPRTDNENYYKGNAIRLVRKFSTRIEAEVNIENADENMVLGKINAKHLASMDIDIHARNDLPRFLGTIVP